MLDSDALRITLIVVALGAIVLRIVAFRSPERRGSAAIGTIALFTILALVVGLFVWSMVGAYVGAFRK